jgi:two-component system, chemotaxis family, sensor kinase Cph1
VASRPSAPPGFGQADLSNCEREQIHLAGSIQPHGALLVAGEPDLVVLQASANAANFLNLSGPLLGCRLDELDGDLAQRIAPHLPQPLERIPLAVRCHVGAPAIAVDVLLHRPPAGGLVVELERAGPSVDLTLQVRDALESVLPCPTLQTLCDETARIVRDLTGYDRVMVYRFDEEGHGEVFAECRRTDLEPFLGNRYPASDIPQIARRLYESNRVRVLVDVEYTPVPLRPQLSPVTGRDLDLSLSFLRSMSPIHIQYLKNMGVGATLVASLMVGGRLWGLISCHHYAPRFVHYEMRAVCELVAETVATRIAALESFARAQGELAVRRLEQRMIQAIARDGDWRSALFEGPQPLLHALGATGAALLFEGQTMTAGEVPGTAQLRDIGEWLDSRPHSAVVATASLGSDAPAFAELTPEASGLLATAVSSSPGEYLIWFRPERIRTVTWGGNPFKAVVLGNDPAELSPRRSFAQWHQLVEGTSEPWTPADLTAARLIGETVTDVVLQFRAVRMLIAQSQLEQVSRQVRRAEQPVVIADPAGRVLLTNPAFDRLTETGEAKLRWIDDLPPLFASPVEMRRILAELFEHRRVWRGEVGLATSGEPRPLMLRADPVFSAPDLVLGFVLLFTDLAGRHAAEAARRQFQEDIVDRHRLATVPLDSRADLIFRNLLSSVVGNAQLAALEITDGVELAQVPAMLDSVQSSVERAAALLERLVWHAAGSTSKT